MIRNFSTEQIQQLNARLKEFITPERDVLFRRVLCERTSRVRVVAEDVFQGLNASALIRSCDVFGIQHFHVIENRNRFSPDSEVAMGAQKWVSIHRHHHEQDNTQACIDTLREEGYRIIATTPHQGDCSLEDFNVDGKNALFFGTEKKGLSQSVLDQADGFLKIPMYGFTESLNVSVSCAIILNRIAAALREKSGEWHLSEQETERIYFDWAMTSIKDSKRILERLLIDFPL